MSEWRWPGTSIARVVDGDTVDARVTRDLGFEATATFPVRLRLNRVNAPKSTTIAGRAAKRRVEELVGAGPLEVITLKSYKYGGPVDTTGEYMAELVLPDGRNVSDILVSERLAVYWDGTGPRPSDSG